MNKIFIISFLILFFSLFQYCTQPKKSFYIKISGETQGTTYNIQYEHKDSLFLKNEIDSLLKNFDLSLSTYEPASTISKINRNEETELDDYFVFAFNKAIEVSEKTGGMFDITVAPLVNAFGFGFTEKSKIDSALIDSLLQFVGYKKVRIENNKLIKNDTRVMLDCNALAQGYAVDIISEFLEKQSCVNYLVEIGGEVKSRGVNEKGEIWRIGIDKPLENSTAEDRELQVIIELNNRAMATSGNYRKFYVEDGVKYSHSIDPKTGWPSMHNLLSVTIIADDCITADAYATACMVIGLEKARQLVNSIENTEAYFIYSNEKGEYETSYTPSLADFIIEIN